MQSAGRKAAPERDERRAIVLEFIAASAIFGIVIVVLYMIFTYRPV